MDYEILSSKKNAMAPQDWDTVQTADMPFVQ
jgi:hypothetical protein